MDYVSGSFEDHYAVTLEGTPDSSDPLWAAQSVEEIGGQWYCPLKKANPKTRVYVLLHDKWADFHMKGMAEKDHDLPPAGSFPQAMYWIPSGRHRDLSGKYEIEGGRLMGTCMVLRARTGYGLVEVGMIHWSNYSGSLWLVADGEPGGSGGGVSSGWASEDWNGVPAKVQNGAPSGWQDVLNRLLQDGVCEEGWDIWLDGVQICQDGQML